MYIILITDNIYISFIKQFIIINIQLPAINSSYITYYENTYSIADEYM